MPLWKILVFTHLLAVVAGWVAHINRRALFAPIVRLLGGRS